MKYICNCSIIIGQITGHITRPELGQDGLVNCLYFSSELEDECIYFSPELEDECLYFSPELEGECIYFSSGVEGGGVPVWLIGVEILHQVPLPDIS